MNRHCHRLIFNASRGILMAVSESAASQGRGRGETGGSLASGERSLIATVKPLVFAVWGVLGLTSLSQAQIVADPSAPGKQQATILSAPNGVPLVNIQTPSAAGVSRNAYRQFDVQAPGAILNNSRSNVQTQLGGWVQGNPWLAGGSARVILNEVNSSHPSLLNGYVEVAGQRAQVVIANPAGISCDGCGFINANRATLTTGTPLMSDGRLTGYRIDGGAIAITGRGLDASGADYADLLTRAVEINAGLWANTLNVVTGANQISVDSTLDSIVTQTRPGTGSAPAFAIDTAEVGGMYAGKIHIIATEAGVGVRHAGQMYASAGDLLITTAGPLENAGQIVSLGATRIAAAALDNQAAGRIEGRQLALHAETLTNRGLINGGDAVLQAPTLDNLGSGRIYGDHLALEAAALQNAAEGDSAPVIAARDRLDIGAATLENREHALIFSAGELAIGGKLDERQRATGQANTLHNASATIESLGDMFLSVGFLDNSNEHFSTKVETVAKDAITEYQGSGSAKRYLAGTPNVYAYQDKSLRLHTPDGNYKNWSLYQYTRTITETQIAETDPGQILAGGNLHIDAETLHNDKSWILAGGDLLGRIGSLTNTEVKGERITTDVGTVTSYSPKKTKKWGGLLGSSTSTKTRTAAYRPAPALQVIDLGATRYEAQAPLAGQTAAIPHNSLYRPAPDPTAHYLIETDPRFAHYRNWLSSDYLLTALAYDPALTQKRLGDGFYEQKLIREQVAQLTGRRFLDGYADDEAQYQALMNAGVAVAQDVGLIPGVALSAAQMAQLTRDIVWLVEQTITLPDGSQTTALVPQLYVRAPEGGLNTGGALIAGNTLQLDLAGELINSGTIAGRQLVAIQAEKLANLQGLIQGKDVSVHAQTDLINRGGHIVAQDSLIATAGHDLTIESATRTQSNAQGGRTNIDRVAGLTVTGDQALLMAAAGHDLNLNAAAIQNGGEGGTTALVANNNVNLGTVTESQSNRILWDSKNWRSDAHQTEVGTAIQTEGDLILQAGHDVNIRGANVSSQGALVAIAGNDVNLGASQRRIQLDEAHQNTDKGLFSSTTTTTRDTLDQTLSQATTFSGDTVTLLAHHDIKVIGSNVVSDHGTTLIAQHDLTIQAATDTTQETHFQDKKTSGLFSSGGIGFTIGTQQQSVDQEGSNTTAAASTIGALNGDVILEAGNAYTQTGSDVIALNGDIDITARQVTLQEARETRRDTIETKFKQTGLTVAITNPIISAIQTADQMHQASQNTSDDRMKALAAGATALSAKNAYDQVAQDPQAAGGVGISITLGMSKSQSKTEQASDTAQGSTLLAGNDVKITATGAGENSDLTVRGSEISAGNNVTLKADGDIKLLAAANTSELERQSSSMSAGVGVAITVGSGGVGFGLTANASAGRGKADGRDTVWSNTHVSAGNQVSLESGKDTNLIGATVAAPQVTADVGGDLNIQSLQDTSKYKSKDQNIGGSVTVGMGFSASASYGQQKIKSDYASVQEQSGIQAGDEGFQVNVHGNTDLKGAVIESTQAAIDNDKNTLKTGTLTTSDIQNHAEYEASSMSLGGGYTSQNYSLLKADGTPLNAPQSGVGANQQGQATTGGDTVPGTEQPSYNGWSATAPIAMSASGDSSSTTKSGISGARIDITDEAGQQERTGKTAEETLASLNRDVTTDKDSSASLKPIFDEKEIKAGFEIVGAFQREVGAFLNNRAKEIDSKNAQAKEMDALASDLNNGLSDEQRLALRDQSIALRAEAQAINDDWGADGSYRQVLTALSAAAGGNVTGGTTQFAQDMLVNYVQQQGAGYIGQLVAKGDLTEGSPLHAALHAIVACAGAAASSQGCSSGALGAATSSVLTGLFSDTSPDETASERQAKANLITSLVAGIAAVSGADTTTATHSAIAAVDNNWLASQQIVQMNKELEEAKTLLEELKVRGKWAYVSKKQDMLTAGGFAKGLAESGWNDLKGLAEFLSHPIEGLNGLKQIISDPNVREAMTDSLFRELDAKIERMSLALEHGGDQHAEQLGRDIGELVWQVGMVATGVGGVAKGGVALAKAGVNIGTKGLESLALATAKFEAGAIKGFVSADELNALMKASEWSPAWKSGTSVAEVTVQPGTTIKMVVNEGQYQMLREGKPAYGGFATFDDVPNQAYARNQLAITSEMKRDVSYVVEVEITRPINAQVGIVGPQGAASGGGNQLHLFIPDGQRGEFLKFVEGSGKALP